MSKAKKKKKTAKAKEGINKRTTAIKSGQIKIGSKKEEENRIMRNIEMEKKLAEQKENSDYAGMIETLAELVKGKDIKPEFMYDAAYAYFMLGDYERAATWAGNTLTYDQGNVPVRILLARLCILQERTDDGLAIFDFVLNNDMNELTDDEKEEIEEITEFYGRTERDKIVRSFPSIAAFLGIEASEEKIAAPEKKSSASDLLARLKAKVAEATDAAQEAKAAAATKIAEAKEELPDKGRSILEQLKEKVAAASSKANQVEESKNEAADTQETSALPTEPLTAMEPVAVPTDRVAVGADGAETTKQSILSKGISTSKKIAMLNSFAGAYYYQKELEGARILLDAALRLDDPEDETLRNMALVEYELGNKETAMQFAAQMRIADFVLLRILRG